MMKTRNTAFRILCLALVVMTLFAMCGCSLINNFVKKDYVTPLLGRWTNQIYLEEDDLKEDLEYFNFYEEEIALADLKACYYVYAVEFNEDKTYYLGIDEEATKAAFTAYIDDLFTKMYENKDDIGAYGGYFAEIASADAFKEEYATNVYSFGSYDEMLTEMINQMYGFYTFDTETGTFEAEADKIHFTKDGDTEAEYVTYELADTLVLHFNDVTREYTK